MSVDSLPLADLASRLLLRVGDGWFECSPEAVRSIEPWQALIALPWPTRLLGVFVWRSEVVPVIDERALGCSSGERRRIALCAWSDGVIGVPASEVRLWGDEALEAQPLLAALDRAGVGFEAEPGAGANVRPKV